VGDQKWADKLNLFFNRFDQPTISPLTLPALLQHPSSAHLVHCPSPTPSSLPSFPNSAPSTQTQLNTQPPCSNLSFTHTQVRSELRKVKAKKAVGPDGISSRLLKSCADQLCGTMRIIFNMLMLGKVLHLWKTSCVVPVPKTPHSKDLSSYRPVAITSCLRQHLPPTPMNIEGMDIEIVPSYKYLGVHLNHKLDRTDHDAALYRKGQSRLDLLRRLRSFGVWGHSLRTSMTLWWHQPSFLE